LKFVFLIAIILISKIVYSTDCTASPIEYDYQTSELVVSGLVISEKIYRLEQTQSYLDSVSVARQNVQFHPATVIEYLVLVETNFKNTVISDTVTIRINNSHCFRKKLVVGNKYILFAEEVKYLDEMYDSKIAFTTHFCSHTQKFKKKVAKQLNKLKKSI
jgi:hypothetical protein